MKSEDFRSMRRSPCNGQSRRTRVGGGSAESSPAKWGPGLELGGGPQACGRGAWLAWASWPRSRGACLVLFGLRWGEARSTPYLIDPVVCSLEIGYLVHFQVSEPGTPSFTVLVRIQSVHPASTLPVHVQHNHCTIQVSRHRAIPCPTSY